MMNIIKLAILLLISFSLNVNSFAQDDFYNEEPKQNNEFNSLDSIAGSDDFENYVTEKDYRSKELSYNFSEKENLDKDEEKKKRQRRDKAEFAIEVFFDVVVNTAFIIAAFWQ